MNFLECLDKIANDYKISILVPKFIYYELDNLNRKYYPDIEVEYKNKVTTFEIKPKIRTLDKVNIAKFISASAKLKNFIVLTEEEIFNDCLEEILLEILV